MKRIWAILAVLGIGGLVAGAGYMGFVSNRPQAANAPAAPLTVAVTTCDVQQTVTAPGSTVNTRTVKLEMPFTGQLAEVLVRAGDAVSAGQVLARLANRETYEAAVAAAELELAQAQQALADLYANAPLKAAQAQLAYAQAQQDLAEAKKDLVYAQNPAGESLYDAVSDAKLALDNAQAALQLSNVSPEVSAYQNAVFVTNWYRRHWEEAKAKYEASNGAQDLKDAMDQAWNAYQSRLNDQNALQLSISTEQANKADQAAKAQEAYDQAVASLNNALKGPDADKLALAEAQVAVKEAQLAQAQGEWESLQNGPEPLEVSEAQARVDKAVAALAEAKRVLEQLEIKAPFAGVVLEANARAGETIPAATALFTLADPQAVEVETTIIEEDVPYVKIGQPADVYFDALPGEIVTGTVARIVPQRLSGDRPLYHVYLTLSRVPAALFEGMSADASIVIAQREGVLCLPRALAQASADGTATVDVWANGETQKHTITVGLRGDTYVEILSGLKEGEAVVAR
jgi:multidrug efflux pump subunit AcrA (membrane-fusion protein)